MMSGLFRIFGTAAIFVCALTLYGALERSERSVAADPSAVLDTIRHVLADSGLRQRDDVSIEMNGRAVALGFSRPGCDGLMLVAVLPHTAQSWAHMAPRLDLSAYQLGYLFQGALYPSVPRLERLAGRLHSDLRPSRASGPSQVIAIAEAGHCGLAPSAARILGVVSKGGMSRGKPPAPNASMGDVSV